MFIFKLTDDKLKKSYGIRSKTNNHLYSVDTVNLNYNAIYNIR